MSVYKIAFLTQERSEYYTHLGESFLRAFKKKSFDLFVVELNIDFRPNLFSKIRNKLLTSTLNKNRIQKINNAAASQIISEKPDIVFVIKGIYLLPDTIKYIKSRCPKCQIMCFNPDDPFNLNNSSSNMFIKDSLLLYDYYFIWSRRLVEKLKNYGVRNVHYFPFALDDKIIYPVTVNMEDAGDYFSEVAFVGNGDKKRNKMIKEISSLLSKEKNNVRLRVYGGNVKANSNIEVRPIIKDENILKAFSGAKINLNILREQNNNSINMRTFEIPGTRSFMLHEYSEEAMEYFRPGIEAEYFKSIDDCVEKIEFYLGNETARERIASAGYDRIIAERYTYSNNISKILPLTIPE